MCKILHTFLSASRNFSQGSPIQDAANKTGRNFCGDLYERQARLDPNRTAIYPPQSSIGSSARYRARFNAVAQELNLPLEWSNDSHAPFHVDAGELTFLPGAQDRYRLSAPSSVLSEAISADVRRIMATVEQRRLDLVEKSALLHKRVVPSSKGLEKLSRAERRAAELFARDVKPAIDRIEARQQNSRAPQLAKYMGRHGDYYSRILFARFQYDSCAGPQYAGDPACSLFPFFPERPPINGMIDPRITLAGVQALVKSEPTNAASLRPTTILSRRSNGSIRAVPLPRHPDFRTDHQTLAAALERIAELDVGGDRLDPRLQRQLRAWATFFRTGRSSDEARAAQATIDAGEGGGSLRVHIGPSESYWDDNIKFPYLLSVGVRDRSLQELLSRQRDSYQALENSLTDVAGYRPRTLSLRGGFADPVEQVVTGGFLQSFPFREPGGLNFPNAGSYATGGSNRFIFLEVIDFWATQIQQTLPKIVDEELQGWDAIASIRRLAVLHESGHLIGPARDHVTPAGDRMGVAFGASWGDAEEPKADLAAIADARQRYRSGQLSPEEMHAAVLAFVGMMFSTRYRGKAAFLAGKAPAHYYGHVIEAGCLFNTGAMRLVDTPNGRRVHIDDEALLESTHALWKKIIGFQAAGDAAGFKAMGEELARAIPDEADRMVLAANEGTPLVFVERRLP